MTLLILFQKEKIALKIEAQQSCAFDPAHPVILLFYCLNVRRLACEQGHGKY